MIIVEKEVNAVTGEETITEREETAAEKKERLHYEKILATEQAELEARNAARQALLDRLGITADEARLLLG